MWCGMERVGAENNRSAGRGVEALAVLAVLNLERFFLAQSDNHITILPSAKVVDIELRPTVWHQYSFRIFGGIGQSGP